MATRRLPAPPGPGGEDAPSQPTLRRGAPPPAGGVARAATHGPPGRSGYPELYTERPLAVVRTLNSSHSRAASL